MNLDYAVEMGVGLILDALAGVDIEEAERRWYTDMMQRHGRSLPDVPDEFANEVFDESDFWTDKQPPAPPAEKGE